MKECPLCGAVYKASAVATIEEHESGHLVHVTCSKCQNAILAMVMITPIGMNSVGMVTDLSAADVVRFRRRAPITEDELLNFHLFLKRETRALLPTTMIGDADRKRN